jgi:DNA-binding winged helix-turn-helix (wHTH) protein
VAKVSATIACLDTPNAESGGAGMQNLLTDVASSLTDPELRRRLELVIQTQNFLPTSSAVVRNAPHGVGSNPIFAGGDVYAFGPFRLFPSRRLLLEGDKRAQIGSRAFDILTVLVQRAGQIVAEHELIAHVWPNVFVGDSNLKTQVSGLRRALGEDRTGRRYIVAVSGRGYNFVSPVSLVTGTIADASHLMRDYLHDRCDGSARRYDVPVVPLPLMPV